ncbi:MAG: hypothetical protein J7623_22155 [Chitinophaga sp.]|uniref:hypothetical protein n=1 Tax=Chitinophaga sp. TaxID=1869181 RepID=UPI001B1ADBCC|nr:hypothetical protein [Chitinophaga sp.]MBO9731359.1 hypothetical protein [Chitinophaga sp.]
MLSFRDGYLLSFDNKPTVIRLDSGLKEVWRKDLQAGQVRYVSCKVRANEDGSLIALSGYNDVRIYDGNGQLRWTFTHEPWESFAGASCFFSHGNQLLWLIAPGDHDRVYVARTSDFAMVDSCMMGGDQVYHYNFLPTPDPEKILIEAAAGQDDCLLYQVQLKDDKIILDTLHSCNDRIAGNFSSNGQELATAPHYSEGIEVFSFPSFTRSAQLEQDDLFHQAPGYPEDALEYRVLFLNDTTLVALTRYSRLLLIDRHTMNCTGELLAEGNDIKAYDENGEITTDPAAIVEYMGEITQVQLDRQHRLMITFDSGDIRWYEIPVL